MFLQKAKKYISLVTCSTIIFVSLNYAKGEYLTSNRDTKLPPEKVSYDLVSFSEYEKLYETNTCIYYFRDDRDVIAIYNKINGYTWKTGLDIPFNSDIDEEINGAQTEEEKLKASKPKESRMNTAYTGIANSLITIEYYDNSNTIKTVSSASKSGGTSTLATLNNDPSKRRLEVKFSEIDLTVNVYITFNENSITYEIKDEEVQGNGKNKLAALIITPFLGASGGKQVLYNKETDMYDIEVAKPIIPGYVFVPDGSGALIRFNDNAMSFTEYVGDIYGVDPTQAQYYYERLSDAIPLKSPVIPVFGIVHGNEQSAFVAHADNGAEYMEIIVKPEENMTNYTWSYPRFVYNRLYHQVYNKSGEGYFKLFDNPNSFNISMTYEFLEGDSADYVGMAQAYRKHLINSSILNEINQNYGDIPIRLDFIMSDTKKGVVGAEDVIVTTIEDVKSVLNNIINKGVNNINSGLYGWQKGGLSFAKPYNANYTSKIGSEKDFKNIINQFNQKNIDISMAQDYNTINTKMVNYYNTAAKHVNSWYLNVFRDVLLPPNAPITQTGYAIPQKSIEWFNKQQKQLSYTNSMTIEGISNILLSDYTSSNKTNITDSINTISEAFKNTNKKLNMDAPNLYLWAYTDRFLQAPVTTSQYIFETDSVPFLEIVLNGTMEVYAPYSNFSFYTQSDILRMIDYNLSPSFILSKEPSYKLAQTGSASLYSTEYNQYEQLIKNVYDNINSVLNQVINYKWTNRTVIQNGVIVNTYTNGSNTKEILINYTDKEVKYKNNTIAALSAIVIQ